MSRETVLPESTKPLHDALLKIDAEIKGLDGMDITDTIFGTNRDPKDKVSKKPDDGTPENFSPLSITGVGDGVRDCATGLSGVVKGRNETVTWSCRWDWDEKKGPHVNATVSLKNARTGSKTEKLNLAIKATSGTVEGGRNLYLTTLQQFTLKCGFSVQAFDAKQKDEGPIAAHNYMLEAARKGFKEWCRVISEDELAKYSAKLNKEESEEARSETAVKEKAEKEKAAKEQADREKAAKSGGTHSKPQAAHNGPVAQPTKPVASPTKPVVPHNKPVVPHSKPVVSSSKPAAHGAQHGHA